MSLYTFYALAISNPHWMLGMVYINPTEEINIRGINSDDQVHWNVQSYSTHARV